VTEPHEGDYYLVPTDALIKPGEVYDANGYRIRENPNSAPWPWHQDSVTEPRRPNPMPTSPPHGFAIPEKPTTPEPLPQSIFFPYDRSPWTWRAWLRSLLRR
jgi:hypothetical protein